MATAGSVDVSVDVFGGLVSDMSPADLPQGVSPDCQDVIFSDGAVKTRPGLSSLITALSGNPTIQYLKSYISLNQVLRTLLIDGAGAFWKETSPLVFSQVASGLPAGSIPVSASIFGREYIALGDGKSGTDMPRQFDDTNFDRVSQVGPGAAPTAIDENVSIAIAASPNGATQPAAVAIAASPNGATEAGTLVTIQTSAAHGVLAGDVVTIAGVGVAGYNGTFTVQSVPDTTHFTYIAGTSGLTASGAGTSASATSTIQTSAAHGFAVGQLVTTSGIGVGGYNGTFAILTVADTTHFTYRAGSGGLAASGGGTAAAAGSIPAGVHKVAVIFVTRQGYLSAPGPSSSWTASGGKRVLVSNIPTGPANILARIVCFTGAAGAQFFFVSGSGATLFSGDMKVNNNSTTSATFDFSDAILLAGTNVDALFKLIELGECAGVIDYAQRLFWWGERNKLNNFVNLSFDGGFTNPGGLPNFPLGWTQDATFAAGGGKDTVDPAGNPQPSNAVWGEAYAITGNGTTATRGLITQGAVKDRDGAPLVQGNTDYTVRARIKKNATLTAGTIHVHLFGTGVNTTGLAKAAADLTTSFVEYSAQLTAALTTIPADLVVRVYADGTPTQNGQFFIDSIEIYPTSEPVRVSLVRASKAEDAESYDGVNGFLQVNEKDGQAVRAAFKLRERLYLVKEHSLYVTEDDGTNEPAFWSISEVSRRVGTPSPRGVARGEDWAVIAHRSGLYIFWGPEPVKISQEIQPTWNTINWQFGHTLWLAVDTRERRIYCGVPTGAATSPNKVLVLDYRDMDDAEAIASRGPIHVTYTGKKVAFDKSRKWAPWTVAANAGALIERADGTAQVWFGNGAGNGKLYQLLDGQLSDDGAAIPSYYTTAFLPQEELEQALGLGAHRKLYTYLTLFAEGAGTLGLTAYIAGLGNAQALAPQALASPSFKDLEATINVLGERVAFKMSVAAVGAWFRLNKFTPSLRPDPWSPVRGTS